MTSSTGNFIRRPLTLVGAGTFALLSIAGVTLVGPGVLAGQSRSAPLPVAMPSASSTVPAPPPANIEPAPDPEPSTPAAVAKPRPAAPKAPARRPTPAAKKTPVTAKPTSATTVPAPPTQDCRQSTDPACGPIRWSPELPAGTPATISWSLEPERPVAGEPFDLIVRWSDAEASYRIGVGYCMPTAGPGSPNEVIGLCADGAQVEFCEGYGTWPLPATRPGYGEERFTKKLPAGSYNFDYGISLSSVEPGAPGCQPDPHRDSAFVKGTFKVLPSP